MKKILIIEDNKTLAKLIAKKIELTLDFEVDVAYRLSEAKLFLKRYDYFLTLLDINLPDAPNGEVVDYVISKGKKAIVLSGNIDKDFRNKILNKNIIDYTTKNSAESINYIVNSIKRLQNNQNHTVLVVDDSMMFRNKLKNLLENLYFNVITVAHGEEALGMINTNPNISLVLTDYNMPVMDGLELTREIRKEHTKEQVHIIAISSNTDDETTAMFLKQGANDYIKKPFSKEEFSCRINNSIEALENLQLMTNYANRDFLTGLYNRRYFYKDMQEYIENIQQSGETFALAMIDIDNFKNINDTHGHDIGDKIIVNLSEILRSNTNYKDIVSRFGGEEFCVVLKNTNRDSAHDIFERLRIEVEKSSFSLQNDTVINYTISLGASMYQNDSLDECINDADMMLYKAKQNGKNQLIFSS